MTKEKKIILVGLLIFIILFLLTVIVFYNISEAISKVNEEIKILQSELAHKEDILSNTNVQLTITLSKIHQKQSWLNVIMNDIEKLESGVRYTLHNPSYTEARNFIYSDNTDTKSYDEETFNCVDFSKEVNNNAEAKGIRCAYVVVNFSDSKKAHALIAFETTDQGLKFFEPQTDERVNLEIGKSYWADCIIPNENYYYIQEPGFTIEAFSVYW